MQYSVPQFTDVEDKIFGPLTLKQFGIIGGAGLLIFLAYSATKDLLITIFAALLIGVPALGLAFGRLNGRPLYNSIGSVAGYFLRPKQLLYHKQGSKSFHILNKREEKKTDIEDENAAAPKSLKNLYYDLKSNQAKENELIKSSGVIKEIK